MLMKTSGLTALENEFFDTSRVQESWPEKWQPFPHFPINVPSPKLGGPKEVVRSLHRPLHPWPARNKSLSDRHFLLFQLTDSTLRSSGKAFPRTMDYCASLEHVCI